MSVVLVGFVSVVILGWCGAGEEAVILSSRSSAQGWVRVPGQLQRIAAGNVWIRQADGTLREYQARTVLRVEADLLPEHREGDRLFAAGQFDEALTRYRLALRSETRPVVTRQIRAQIIWCLRYLHQPGKACEEFFAAADEEFVELFGPVAPVNWLSAPVDPVLETTCRKRLSDPVPVRQLVAASFLLQGGSGAQAEGTLNRLAASASEPIRTLAWFQLCRRKAITAQKADVTLWEKTWEKLPHPWRAGPTVVIAQGWEACQQHELAALWWLKVPLVYPEHRDLAARGLLAAGRDLERLGRPDQAASLYRELLTNYPESPDRQMAELRLRELGGVGGPPGSPVNR